MASKTAICNLALIRIGVSKQLTDVDTDATVEALTCLAVFDSERDTVLADFPWAWASAYADPVLFAGDSTAPANKDWAYVYTIPSDAMRIRRIINPIERRNGRRCRTFQFGGDPGWPPPFKTTVAALGTITIGSSNVANNDTLTINSRVYTWKTTLTGAANEILIGSTSSVSATNLYEALNAGANAGTDYGTGTAVNADVTAIVSGSVVVCSGLSAVATTWSKSSTNTTLKPTAGPALGKFLFSNEPSISIEYTRKVAAGAAPDFGLYDPMFVSAFAWRLGFSLSLSLARDPKMAQLCMAAYQNQLTAAQARDASESEADEPMDAEWIRGR